METANTTAAIEIAFYREVANSEILFTIIDDKGIPTPEGEEGIKVMPFWSSEQNAQAFIANNAGYSEFKPYPVNWQDFKSKWLEGLVADDLLVGLNWQDATAANCATEVELVVTSIIDLLKSKPLKAKQS